MTMAYNEETHLGIIDHKTNINQNMDPDKQTLWA